MLDTWDRIKTWNLVLPPSRPSLHHLAFVRNAIQDLSRSAPIAILGATPEFRDLLHELGFTTVTLLERNLASLEAMSKLRVYDNAESLVHGDWLDTLPSLRHSFAAILSDLTMGNVPYERRADFYASIQHALLPGGRFVDKILTHPGPHIPLDDLIAKYATLPLNLLYINHFSCEVFFCSSLLNIADTVDSTRFYEALQSLSPPLRITAFVRATPQITPPGCLWFYGRKWDHLETEYFKPFTLLKAVDDEPTSPYYGRLSLHVCEAR